MADGGEKRYLKSLWVTCLWVLVWQAASMLVALPVLLPGPWATLRTLAQLAGRQSFWLSMLMSFARIATGYMLAILTGTALAALCAFSRPAESMLSPLRTLIRSTPISSFIILVLLWLRTDRVPVLISFLTVLPIIWQNVQTGMAQVDPELLEMARAYRFDSRRKWRHIYVPSVSPYLYTAAATGVGFAWKSGIAAEVIARPALSIGKHLQDSKVYLMTEELFAWTLTVILLSIALETVLKAALTRRTKAVRRA